MATAPRSRTAVRRPLTRERVLRAAIKLADQGGIDGLSMRKLGQELGVEAMSLYNHAANKDDILDGIVELVVSEFVMPTGDDWRAALRASQIGTHDVLVRHPWAASLMLSETRVRPARLRFMDSILGCLRSAGFSPDMTHHAYHALDSHLMGFTLWAVQMSTGMARLPRSVSGFLEALDADAYPWLAEHIEQHLRPTAEDGEGEFAFGLDLLLDGLEALLDPGVRVGAAGRAGREGRGVVG
jgi:AcrR family transcriptional regulator